MGSILSYSGLSTKIRAMQSKLITEDQLAEIIRLPGVPQAAAYLKRTPAYADAWAAVDENNLHRGQIEKMLKASIFRDFSKIYSFANSRQRTFLDLYSKRYEIRVLKEMITNIFDHRETDPVDLSPYREFFRRHSKLDLDALNACRTMPEFINALKGNEFYIPLSHIQDHENALLFDYGMALDLYYFTQIWNVRKKLFSGNDLKEITFAYGEKFDMLNLQFIQRSKQCFNMQPADIYALLIPVNYKLKKEEIRSLVEAASYEESIALFRRTYYGKKFTKLSATNLEEFYNYILRHILEKESRRDPYSVATLYSYLYHKEHEVNRLTIAIECVRYGVEPDDAMRYIRSN
ncbi:MAG: V-type ATPase subunit [Blautia sp.]|nr:V-type ATPase subunit [Blautia sp.]MDY3998535.1 V-type ATPase subunit [Blautia sp.]